MMRRRSKNKHLRVDCVALHHFEELSSGDACGNPVDYYKSARLGDGKFSKGLAGGIAYIHTAGQANVYRKDFTIECWVKVSGGIQIDAGLRINLKSSAHTSFYYCQVGVNFAFLEEGTGKVSLLLGNSNQTDWVNSTQLLGRIPVDNQFHHFAFVGTANSFLRVFIDGTQTWSSGNFTIPVSNAANSTIYACSNEVCVIDELLFTHQALYTSDFIPPVAPYSI